MFVFARTVLLALAVATAPLAWGQIVFDHEDEPLSIGEEIFLLLDSGYTVDEALNAKHFVQSEVANPNLLNGKDVWNWVKFEVKNESSSPSLRLIVQQAFTDHFELYSMEPNGTYDVQVISQTKPFNERKFKHATPVFELNVAPGESRTFLMKVHGKETFYFPAFIMTPDVMREELSKTDRYLVMYSGIVLAMLIFNIFVYVKMREKSYKLYLFHLASVLITQATLEGYTFQYLWPNFPWLEQYALFIFPCITGSLTLLFFRVFLKTKSFIGNWDKIGFVLIGSYVALCMLPAALGNYPMAYNGLNITALLISFYILIVSAIIWYRKGENARIFFIAWSVFLVGVVLYTIKDLGVGEYNQLTRYTMLLGSGLEMMLISYAMVDRFRKAEQEKIRAQQKELEAYREKERILEAQESEIATQVQRRTRELQNSNEELELALNELQEVQQNLERDFQQKNDKLAQKNLQLQMNPHFLFNSLTSIQMMVLNSDKAEASRYLSRYARLMRLILENSRQDFVPFDLEIEALKRYIELEQLRFSKQFNYDLRIPNESELEDIHVPPMIIQPYVENAILHGLLEKKDTGNLCIDFSITANDQLLCVVDDDGIGRQAASELKVMNNKRSIGLEATMKRLNLWGERLEQQTMVNIEDKTEGSKAKGTRVELLLPVQYSN